MLLRSIEGLPSAIIPVFHGEPSRVELDAVGRHLLQVHTIPFALPEHMRLVALHDIIWLNKYPGVDLDSMQLHFSRSSPPVIVQRTVNPCSLPTQAPRLDTGSGLFDSTL